MEQPAPKQRSPWLYVLLGCGGFALLSCLGLAAFGGLMVMKAKDVAAGITDPAQRSANAKKMLGAIPEGYEPIASFSILGMFENTVLLKGTLLADGGVTDVERALVYVKAMGGEGTAATKKFFNEDGNDTSSLQQSGIQLDPEDVIKRGAFSLDGRTLRYVVARADLTPRRDPAAQPLDLSAVVLFDCPGDQLNLAVWSMPDPSPGTTGAALDLTDTVGDEAQLVPFFKRLTPCSK